MTAQLQIDQVGLPAGTPGRSRTDGLATGAVVTLTNTGAGATTAFRLLWTPPGDTSGPESLEATEDPTVWTFTPTAGKYGSYLIELVVNAGLTSEVRERRVLGIRTARRGLLIPALNERGNRLATLLEPGSDEAVDNNADDASDPDLAALPFAAWWRALHELIVAVDALPPTLPVARVVHYSASGLTTTFYDTLAAALAAGYPSSFPSSAVYDLAPNAHSPTPGPITLDTVVSYVLRSAAGRGAVTLPEMTLQSAVRIEGCDVAAPLTGGALTLRECDVSAALSNEAIDARDSTFASTSSATVSGSAVFDRCALGAGFTVTADGLVEFVNCTFGASPSVVFSGDPGVVYMDARSNYLFDAAGGAVTNGTIVVQGLL